MYVNWHIYLKWHTVSRSTYIICMSVDILYVWSTYYMSIEILCQSGVVPIFKCLGKHSRPRSDCSWRSCLIRVCTVCHSIYIIWAHYSMVIPHCSVFRIITVFFSGVWIFLYLYGDPNRSIKRDKRNNKRGAVTLLVPLAWYSPLYCRSENTDIIIIILISCEAGQVKGNFYFPVLVYRIRVFFLSLNISLKFRFCYMLR